MVVGGGNLRFSMPGTQPPLCWEQTRRLTDGFMAANGGMDTGALVPPSGGGGGKLASHTSQSGAGAKELVAQSGEELEHD